jgi:hypothetical protein
MEEVVAYYKAPHHYFPAGYEENNKHSRTQSTVAGHGEMLATGPDVRYS